MNRDYKNETSNKAVLFIGDEVENTPAKGTKTLFVVGEREIDEILKFAKQEHVYHVYFGANHSFTTNSMKYWNNAISFFLQNGYWVTLDYSIEHHEQLVHNLHESIWMTHMFIPNISCKLPKLSNGNRNTIIKIDDADFNKYNPGVWCIKLSNLTKADNMTTWDKYKNDKILVQE